MKIEMHDFGTVNPLSRKLKILILGNGTSTATTQESSEVTFTFNGKGSFMEPISSIDVWMSRDSFGEYRLKLSGTQNKVLWTSVEDQLNQSLELQMAILGCLPSTGYALVHGLWQCVDNVVIDGVGFNPSLARPTCLPPRKPQPQAFHNWLGERRTTFQRWLAEPRTSWSWSLFQGIRGINRETGSNFVTHIEVLEAFKAASRSGSFSELKDVAQSPVLPAVELLHETKRIRDLEQQFHLCRLRSDTPNWWLYDTDVSVIVERIAENLRSAQEQAFVQHVSQRVRVG
ncbi:hypothetical protein [Comamonas sp.]|uniref:hypothetical protein n=1 Tax=Comamonas sp. TaxID=34028 RepID=UPI00130D812F|nr:hypothetical protein [Comamonas testosteroni]